MKPRVIAAVALAASSLVGIVLPASPAVAAQPGYQIGHGDGGKAYLISPDGSNNQFVANVFGGEFDWTTDGLKLVYRENQAGNIILRNQDGAEFPVTTGGRSPALSPDGTKIALVQAASDGSINDEVKVVDLSGNVLAEYGQGRSPTWSPDGTKIAFGRKGDSDATTTCDGDPRNPPEPVNLGRGSGLAVASFPPTGGTSWLVEPNLEIEGLIYPSASAPDWSPNDLSIVYFGYPTSYVYNTSHRRCTTRRGAGDGDVLVVNSSGGEPTNLTEAARYVDQGSGGTGDDYHPFDGNPSYSPDGETIAFASSRDNLVNVIHSLYTMTASGGQVTKIYQPPGTFDDPGRIDATDWRIAPIVGQVVRIEATQDRAFEQGATPGVFTVERTGSTDGELEVTIATAGTATPGADYRPLPSTVTIPDGTSSINLLVVPVDDTAVEGNETVVVEVQDADGYILGEPNRATVTIVDNDGPSGPGPGEVDAELEAKKKQNGHVKAKVSCDTACIAKITGNAKLDENGGNVNGGKNPLQRAGAAIAVELGGKKGKGADSVKMKPQTKRIAAGGSAVLRLKPKGKKNARKLAEALDDKKVKVTVPLKVKVTEAEGDSVVLKKIVQLKAKK